MIPGLAEPRRWVAAAPAAPVTEAVSAARQRLHPATAAALHVLLLLQLAWRQVLAEQAEVQQVAAVEAHEWVCRAPDHREPPVR